MIYEINIIDVIPEQADGFLETFSEAASHLRGVAGCRLIELLRCHEDPARYLVRIGWEGIEDHRDHYPTTEAADRVRALLRPLIATAQPAHYALVPLGG